MNGSTAEGSILFRPLTVGKLELAGRVFKSATSETRATEDGRADDELLEFYEPIAAAGTPLIITGNGYVHRQGKATPRQWGADHDDKIPGLRRLVDGVHRHGSRIFAQLNHCGRQVLPRTVGLEHALSASDVKELSLGTKPRPMTLEEIREAVAAFGAAAGRCQEAGFDGVQIHAAHGYLISQFLTPHTNRRKDDYGGPLDNRLRFLREVYRATRERVGPDFPVIMKLNGADSLPLRRGLKPAELAEIALAMEREGLDGVEVSIGHYESGMPVVRGTFWRFFRGVIEDGTGSQLPTPQRWAMRLGWPLFALVFNLLWWHYQGFNLKYARRFKQRLSMPVICVGGFRSRAAMERAIADGLCDAVSCARSMIANPYLYRHLRSGESGPRCVFCNACIGRVGGLPVDCYHPRVRAEKDRMLAAAD